MSSFFFGSKRTAANNSATNPANLRPPADFCPPISPHPSAKVSGSSAAKTAAPEKTAATVAETHGAKAPSAELVFILDASGSMMPLISDTVGGYNSVLSKAASAEGNALVTTVFFNQKSKLVHDRVPIGQVELLSQEDYVPGGTTALLDTVGETIERIDLIQTHQPEAYKPRSTTLCIITDGLENASHRFGYPQIKQLISSHKELGWEFLFLGANIDVAEQAESLGIDAQRAAAYDADSTGTFAAFESFGEVARCACMGAPIDDSWRDAVDQDQKRREKHRRS